MHCGNMVVDQARIKHDAVFVLGLFKKSLPDALHYRANFLGMTLLRINCLAGIGDGDNLRILIRPVSRSTLIFAAPQLTSQKGAFAPIRIFLSLTLS